MPRSFSASQGKTGRLYGMTFFVDASQFERLQAGHIFSGEKKQQAGGNDVKPSTKILVAITLRIIIPQVC